MTLERHCFLNAVANSESVTDARCRHFGVDRGQTVSPVEVGVTTWATSLHNYATVFAPWPILPAHASHFGGLNSPPRCRLLTYNAIMLRPIVNVLIIT